jgi:hypothetical protein
MEDMIVSDCCGVEMDGILMDHGICPDCGEHCEAVSYDSEPDHIPGYDDGEWDPIMGDSEDCIETDDEWLDDFQGEEDFA